MFFSIDPSNGLAIYDQIVRQVTFAIATEGLATGELVPSVRELAKRLAVNPNTVARAYRELQNEGILHAVRGTGLEVAPQAVKICRQSRAKLIRDRLAAVLLEALQSGLDKQEIRSLLEDVLKKLEPKAEHAS
ncbi:MAG: GntR family transcriptional regulator [Planctomycetota bacterium]